MWHVWHAWGCLASATEKVWRVWQASQDALPEPGPRITQLLQVRIGLQADFVAPTAPFMPSMRATGWACALGMAFIAAQATACFPRENCSTRSVWHGLHVSGVGIKAFATSPADECWSP